MPVPLIGESPAIQKIRELISVVSDTAFNVLITGETGTGKEVVARLLHYASARRDRKFVKVNCAALPFTLLESELFGYEKGAFTGAHRFKPGKFEIASGGVIFLDEIGDMPLGLQTKLLEILQSGEFTRLGGTKEVRVDSWVISATNQDLPKLMAEGRFREDLFYRLNIIKIDIPPLRDRKEDIPLLVDYFIQKHRRSLQMKSRFRIDDDMRRMFEDYHWPGNVRELSSAILRLMVGEEPTVLKEEFLRNMISDGIGKIKGDISLTEDVMADQLEGEGSSIEEIQSLKELKAEATRYIEKRIIRHALETTNWNKAEASRLLKISYKALFYKMKALGIGRNEKGCDLEA